MNNSNVAHNWANQTGKGHKSGNMFYDGMAIYSYGTHYMAGLLVDTKARGRIALINSRKYSVSTSRHVSYVARAVSHLPRFYVPELGTNAYQIALNYAYFLREIEAAQLALTKTRKYAEMCERDLRAAVDRAAAYLSTFPAAAYGVTGKEGLAAARRIKALVRDMAAGTLIDAKARAAIDKKIAAAKIENAAARKREAERAAARAIEMAAKRAEDMAQLDQWTAGLPGVAAPYSSYAGPCEPLPTRLRIKGAAVETSRGAVVSCRAARIAWAAIKAGRDIVGMVIDGYTISHFNGELKIGCHTISRAEVERIGALLDAAAAKNPTIGEMDSTNV